MGDLTGFTFFKFTIVWNTCTSGACGPQGGTASRWEPMCRLREYITVLSFDVPLTLNTHVGLRNGFHCPRFHTSANSGFAIQNEPGTVWNLYQCLTNYRIQSFDWLRRCGNQIACPWVAVPGFPGCAFDRGGHQRCACLVVSTVLSRRKWVFEYTDRYQIFFGLVRPRLERDWDYEFEVNQIVRANHCRPDET